MRKIYIIMSVAASLLSIFSSCSKIEEKGPSRQPADSLILTIACPEGESKSSLNKTKPVWNAGDEIWVSDGSASCKAVIENEYDGCTIAPIKVAGLSGNTFYALYPFDGEASVNDGNILVDIPSLQDGEFASAGICVGTCTTASTTISLHSVCPVLHFISNNENLVSMQLNNKNGTISGKILTSATTGACTSYSRSDCCIRLDFDERHNEFYLATTPSTFTQGSKMIFTTADSYIGTVTMSKANSLAKGIIYEMGNVNDHIVFGSEPATDLSICESANCYVAAPGKPYRFNAVKGNSSESVGDVAYAEIVWETVNTATAPAQNTLIDDLIYSDGYVYFNIPENAPDGNALIAVKDSSGEILWSWHIWILEDGVSFQTLADGSYLMDRNLGALGSEGGITANLGFLYQWGRKDPFPQSKLAGKEITKTNCTTATGTLDYSAKNPNCIIYNSGGGSWLNEDMLLWSADAKTIYDPCPAGYHIPTSAILKLANGGSWNSSKKTFVATVNGNTVNMPAAGRTVYNTGEFTQSGTYGYYWYSCTTGSTAKTVCRIGSNGMQFYSQSSSSPYSPQAFSVRCQKVSDKDESQKLTMTYSVTEGGHKCKSLWYSSTAEHLNAFSWGDGTSLNLRDSVAVYHTYASSGEYSVSLQGYDIDFFKIRSLGDITEIDLSNL